MITLEDKAAELTFTLPPSSPPHEVGSSKFV